MCQKTQNTRLIANRSVAMEQIPFQKRVSLKNQRSRGNFLLKNNATIIKKIVIIIAITAFAGGGAFAQQKSIEKMYNQLDSLENRVLELKRENDKAVLECAKDGTWKVKSDCLVIPASKAGIVPDYNGYDHLLLTSKQWEKIQVYAQEICECLVGKKHEIEAVETQIKQLERRIDLLKSTDKSTQPIKK